MKTKKAKAASSKKPSSKNAGTKKKSKNTSENATAETEQTATQAPLEIPVEDEQTSGTTSKGRNNDKYQFNGNSYGKGPLVREVVRQYVTGHPKTNFKKLKEVFPDELLHRFGIFQEIDHARSFGARERFFFKEEHQIKLADKKVIVICNQFTSANIQPFLKTAKALGFKIK